MFGWEFPPFISGGLGTASLGISKGLVSNEVEVSFVLPTRRGQEISSPVNIIAADEVPLIKKYSKYIKELENFEERFSNREFTIAPYFTQEIYKEFFERLEKIREIRNTQVNEYGILNFTGNYGKDLLNEVRRYGIIGEVLGLSEEFDIIHAHDWLTYYAGVASKIASGKPLVVHVHATEFDRSGENVNQEVYDIERFGMDNADKIVAVSYYTRNIIINRYGQDPDKVVVVHNAVNKDKSIESFGIKKSVKEKIVLFLGRITMQKGPDYFLEAANIVARKVKNVRFVMAGSGDMLPRMINRMAEYRLIDRFHFTGFLTGTDVEKMYAMSDIYVMPSVSEPFGISPFEALVYDVPIIISKQSGVAEILKNALKIDFWDVNKLAELMILLLENEDAAKEITEKSKHDMETVGWDSAGGKLKSIYVQLLTKTE